MNVWIYPDEIEKIARLDNWAGIPFMIFGNMLVWFGFSLYISLCVVFVGAIFLFFVKSPIYLLETTENDDTVYASLVDVRDYVFRFGLSSNQVLSGPYFDDDLRNLKQDLDEIGDYIGC